MVDLDHLQLGASAVLDSYRAGPAGRYARVPCWRYLEAIVRVADWRASAGLEEAE